MEQETNSSTGTRSEPGTPKIQDKIFTTVAGFLGKAVWAGYNA
jgi:hypothetical protein